MAMTGLERRIYENQQQERPALTGVTVSTRRALLAMKRLATRWTVNRPAAHRAATT